MKLIYVDIDETICNREASSDFGVVHDYTKAQPIKENIEKINKLYDEGNQESKTVSAYLFLIKF